MEKMRRQVVTPKNVESLITKAKKEIERAENMRKLVHGPTYKDRLKAALKKAKTAYKNAKSAIKKFQSISPVVYVH
jgi:hypothetical protein